jgi:hypothetical protein
MLFVLLLVVVVVVVDKRDVVLLRVLLESFQVLCILCPCPLLRTRLIFICHANNQ